MNYNCYWPSLLHLESTFRRFSFRSWNKLILSSSHGVLVRVIIPANTNTTLVTATHMCTEGVCVLCVEILRQRSRNNKELHSFTGAYSPGWTFGLPFRWFLITHIQTRGRTPLDEWSARRRGLYLHRTTQHINTTNIHVPSGIRTRDPSNQAAADLRLRPRGYWDRQKELC
jgi:hypothetical protein